MRFYRALAARPFLVAGLALGVLTALALQATPNPIWPSSRALAAWDAGAASFIALVVWGMRDTSPEDIARRAGKLDEGRHLILTLCLLAAAVSVWAIMQEFGAAKAEHGLDKTLHIGFALATVAISWLFVHVVFASHYAHEYYGREGERARGGLAFPGDQQPDFWDFLHFSLVIGVALQTADIRIESKAIRRLVTVHGIVAFLFNVVILAFAVNLAASVF
jgi:uncharacterized membrane protein